MRMSAASRPKRARSSAGVSPVRIAISGTVIVRLCARATAAMPSSGARRLRSTSTASALSGEMYKTRHRDGKGGAGENITRLRHQRNAASVLPLPVGASMRVDSPRAIAGQPSCCGVVGEGNVLANHSVTAGWNISRAARRDISASWWLVDGGWWMVVSGKWIVVGRRSTTHTYHQPPTTNHQPPTTLHHPGIVHWRLDC